MCHDYSQAILPLKFQIPPAVCIPGTCGKLTACKENKRAGQCISSCCYRSPDASCLSEDCMQC